MSKAPFLLPPALSILLAACAGGGAPGAEIFAPRAAEAIDPRVPVAVPPPAPANDALVAEARAIAGRAADAHRAFEAEAAAQQGVLAGGASAGLSSEAWIAAQQGLSALVRARGGTAMALADLDRLATGRVAGSGGIGQGDLDALAAVSAEVKAIDAAEEAVVARWQAALAR